MSPVPKDHASRRVFARSGSIVALAALLALAACAPGAVESPTASIATSSPSPTADPLSIASFRGSYEVVRTVTEVDEFSHKTVGEVETRGYSATPACATGPCDVTIEVTNPETGQTGQGLAFKWVDSLYRYDVTEPVPEGTCTVENVEYTGFESTTLTELRPIEAALVDGELVLTKLSTTMHYAVRPVDDALAAGCIPSSYDTVGTVTRSTGGTEATPSPITTAAPAAALPAADTSCQNEATTKSDGAVGATSYTIANHTALTLTVYWVNYEGQREKWFDLAAGQTQAQDTFKTHPWLVAGPAGGCLMIFSAPATIVIG